MEESAPGRTLLWTHWCMIDDENAPEELLVRRARFTQFLENNGIRAIRCPVKPSAMHGPETDNNACDFYVAESIRLACKVAKTVIVATGDGHLRCVTNNVHFQEGRRVEIVCEKRSLSKSLQADRFHYLERIVREYDITRDGSKADERLAGCQRKLLVAS
jgi:hypothetical protein